MWTLAATTFCRMGSTQSPIFVSLSFHSKAHVSCPVCKRSRENILSLQSLAVSRLCLVKWGKGIRRRSICSIPVMRPARCVSGVCWKVPLQIPLLAPLHAPVHRPDVRRVSGASCFLQGGRNVSLPQLSRRCSWVALRGHGTSTDGVADAASRSTRVTLSPRVTGPSPSPAKTPGLSPAGRGSALSLQPHDCQSRELLSARPGSSGRRGWRCLRRMDARRPHGGRMCVR